MIVDLIFGLVMLSTGIMVIRIFLDLLKMIFIKIKENRKYNEFLDSYKLSDEPDYLLLDEAMILTNKRLDLVKKYSE